MKISEPINVQTLISRSPSTASFNKAEDQTKSTPDFDKTCSPARRGEEKHRAEGKIRMRHVHTLCVAKPKPTTACARTYSTYRKHLPGRPFPRSGVVFGLREVLCLGR
jgi:hypothetical protein